MNIQQNFQPLILTKQKIQRASMRLKLLLVAMVSIVGQLAMAVNVSALNLANPPIACNDVQFIFARGSGEPLGGSSATAWQTALRSKLRSSTLTYGFYELGSRSWGGYQYPAAAVSGSAEGVLTLVGAALSQGKTHTYGDSVKTGINELKTYIERTHNACPKTKFVLGGYSQGGQVISTTLPDLDADQIIYAATFGDPKLYLPEGAGLIPPACLGQGFSNYREFVPNCRAHNGVLGGTKPYQPSTYIDKLGVWCNQNDIMCSGNFSIDAHTAYTTSGLYDDAATTIVQKISTALPLSNIHAWWLPGANLKDDVAFLIDTSASMNNVMRKYINEAKTLAQHITERGGRIALFEYRDLDDPFEPRAICDFSCDYETFAQKLETLRIANGGDLAESALSAMKYTMNTLDWRNGATKSLILLTDADYHNPDRDHTLMRDVVNLSLAIDPVNIYVITKPKIMPAYEELTRLTGGRVFNVDEPGDLTLSTSMVLNRPTVQLPLAEYVGQVGETFTFNATATNRNGSSAGLKYEWDLDGDGEFERSSPNGSLDYQYSAEFHGIIQVKVTNQDGLSSTMSAKVDVYDELPETATIDFLSATPIIGGEATVNFVTKAWRTVILVDNEPVGYLESSIQNNQENNKPVGYLESATSENGVKTSRQADSSGAQGRAESDAKTQSFTLRNLASAGIEVTLVPYNSVGWAGTPSSVTLTSQVPLAPNTGTKN